LTGLGTSTAAEAKEYFSNLVHHRISFRWDPNASEMIEMAFKKTNASKRKDWLNAFDESQYVDHSIKTLTISDFINKELILFSRADNMRSIPCVVDGLKPGQRKVSFLSIISLLLNCVPFKVLFACFKKKLKNEMKVAQLAGYVSEQTSYHHGEQSLHSTIINMAQQFVGSNNIPLLFPSGQFGSR
jgi:DNA topoisomerase-2